MGLQIHLLSFHVESSIKSNMNVGKIHVSCNSMEVLDKNIYFWCGLGTKLMNLVRDGVGDISQKRGEGGAGRYYRILAI